jgi:DNA-binding XRE family transcriptional regulator
MQVHVKSLHTNINIEGKISSKLLKILKKDFGNKLIIEDAEWIPATETEWYTKTKASMKPGDHLRAYRVSRGLTQTQLAKTLERASKQNISDMENGRSRIGVKIAKKLAEIFNASVEKFL